MQEKLSIAANKLREEFQLKKNEYEQEYLHMLEDSTKVYNQEIQEKQIELQKLVKEIFEDAINYNYEKYLKKAKKAYQKDQEQTIDSQTPVYDT